MMQPAIDIPRPMSADNETVATALETAALFGSKGDALEAVRWLRRAAESAGEAGDDLRALALSRSAADLNEELSAKHSLTVPSPPPAPSVAPPLPSVAPPRPSAAPAPPSSPPPSSRQHYPTPPSSRPSIRAAVASHPPVAPATHRHADGPHATRVAIHRSAAGPGLFEVRLLAEGEAARPGDSEAFLVMIDPHSTLLSS